MKLLKTTLLLSFALHTLVAAAQAPDIFSGEVPVVDESPATRALALQQILRQVMVRVGGQRSLPAGDAANAVLQDAGALVQQFRYRSASDAADGEGAPQRYLRARFDPSALQRAMIARKLPVWLGERPRVLLWVASEERGARRLLGVGDERELRELLLQRAQERGMPLQLPLLDLEDRAAITAGDVWSGFAGAIERASQRYPHDVVLTASATRSGAGRWLVAWRLWRDGQYRELSSASDGLGEALASGLDLVQDQLAQQTGAVLPDQEGMIRISVQGVGSLQAYAYLMQSLRMLPQVTAIAVLQAESDRLLLGVAAEGGREFLTRALLRDPSLLALPAAAPDPTEVGATAPALHYLLIESGAIEQP